MGTLILYEYVQGMQEILNRFHEEGVDSAETARADMVNLYKSWLESAGVFAPPDIQVEISPSLR